MRKGWVGVGGSGWIRPLLLAAGLAVAGWLLGRVGWGEAWGLVASVGWRAPVLLLPYLAVYMMDCMGWRWTLPSGLGVGFARLLAIRWSGEAVNNVVPTGHVGGEVVKVYLLGRQGVGRAVAAGAAVVSKTSQTLAQVMFISIAAWCFAGLVPGDSGWRRAMWMALGGGVMAVGVMLWVQWRGLFRTLAGVLCWRGCLPGWLARREGALRELDGRIGAFYAGQPGRMAASVASYLGGWFLDSVEIWVAGWLLGQPVTMSQAVAVEGFVGIAKLASMWVPGAVGVQEGGILVLGRAVGLGEPFCMAYALMRRAREAIFAAVGWLLLWSSPVNLGEVPVDAGSRG